MHTEGDSAKLAIKDLLLEAVGWIAFIILLLAVLVIVGTVVFSLYFDFRLGLLLLGSGIALGAFRIAGVVHDFLVTSPPRTISCPYCGMRNPVDALTCVRCERLLSK